MAWAKGLHSSCYGVTSCDANEPRPPAVVPTRPLRLRRSSRLPRQCRPHHVRPPSATGNACCDLGGSSQMSYGRPFVSTRTAGHLPGSPRSSTSRPARSTAPCVRPACPSGGPARQGVSASWPATGGTEVGQGGRPSIRSWGIRRERRRTGPSHGSDRGTGSKRCSSPTGSARSARCSMSSRPWPAPPRPSSTSRVAPARSPAGCSIGCPGHARSPSTSTRCCSPSRRRRSPMTTACRSYARTCATPGGAMPSLSARSTRSSRRPRCIGSPRTPSAACTAISRAWSVRVAWWRTANGCRWPTSLAWGPHSPRSSNDAAGVAMTAGPVGTLRRAHRHTPGVGGHLRRAVPPHIRGPLLVISAAGPLRRWLSACPPGTPASRSRCAMRPARGCHAGRRGRSRARGRRRRVRCPLPTCRVGS